MADIDFLKRQYYVSALGLTEAQAAKMTINDLEYQFFSTGGDLSVTHPNTTDVLVRKWDSALNRWQRIHYDSGLRLVPYTLGLPNWTAGDLYLRRQNDIVSIWMNGVKMAAIGTKIYDLPSAFKPGNYGEPIGAIFRESQTTGNPYWFSVEGAAVASRGVPLVGTFAPTYAFSGAWTFTTNAGLPADLPGTYISSAPAV